MIDIENLQTEVQARVDALGGTPTKEQVLEVGIAARSVELAGGSINRSALDTAIQTVIDELSNTAENADLIALGATLPRSTAASSVEVGTYVTGLFKGNPKYLQCNNNTYLRSAYPDLTDAMLSSLTQQVSISVSENTNISSLIPSYEQQSSVYKVNGKYYKLSGGASNTSGWTSIPIQSSLDGISYTPISAPTHTSPLTFASASCQMDTLVATGSTIVVFGRVYVNDTNYIVQLKSLNDGVSWVFSSVRGGSHSPNDFNGPVLAARIGNTLMVHGKNQQASSVLFSTNLGATWSGCSDSDLVNSSKYVNGLIQDGTRFVVGFTDGSTSYSTGSDPSGSVWTLVPPPNIAAKGVLGVVDGKWIMGGESGYVATCTTPGTWVAQSTCTSGMPTFNISKILVNGAVIAFSGLGTTSQIFYCTDAGTLPAVAAVVADALIGSPAKLSLSSVSDGHFYVLQSLNSILKSTSLAVNSFSAVQVGMDVGGTGYYNTVDYGVVKKYGYYFYSVGGAGQNKRYMSSDLKTWSTAPSAITTGCGAVVDAGTRLLALDDNHLLLQSTDGKVWDTTGITRPSLGGSPYSYAARLFVCTNGWVYYVRFLGASSHYMYVSKNNGSTWTSVSGLPLAGSSSYSSVIANPCLFKEINGTVYSLSVNYFDSAYGFYLSKSTDGMTFTYITGVSNGMINANINNKHGIFEVDDIIYVFVAADSPAWWASYDNGVSFSAIPAYFAPAALQQLVSNNVQYIRNTLSSQDFMYVRSFSPESLFKWSVDTLSPSANYSIADGSKSPLFVYENAELNMVTPNYASTGSKLIRLSDANVTFTLPSIANTWLRALS